MLRLQQDGFSLLWVVAALALACASGGIGKTPRDSVEEPDRLERSVSGVPPGSGEIREFLTCETPDGVRQRVGITPEDMPWRVSIGFPQNPPKYGSRVAGRDAAISAMRQWEHAIGTQLDWFQLEFVENDPGAPVQIRWKRRMTGSASGRAGPTCRLEDGLVRAGGRMEVSVRSCPTCAVLTLDEVRMLFAHEFGHILGLGHCLDCDSAMNYSWHTRDRVFVTQTDVDAVVRFLGRSDTSEAKGGLRVQRADGVLVRYDATTSTIAVRHGDSRENTIYHVNAEGSDSGRTNVKINGVPTKLTELSQGDRLSVYWTVRGDRERFARMVDVW